ncbi:TonB-dependent receptor [Dinghuibacter silviterrae]|uniref:Outer membrane receptor for ferrienterochelin and colicin n=1 Tax=Dinghuibacter silviterrae TaxID=1539049 RepID=A0A4R8DHK8_9BACT|nr:TonB-dependent receptor [Dinghuibacter silviterrae]TDW96938.1 outer membrane receptor for ferrienterochelin and colicin [Dinghuibacter silviterrae]
MKKMLNFLCALLVSSLLKAQGPPPGGPGGINGPGGTGGTAHVYGKLVDSTGKAVVNASVMILKVDDARHKNTLLKGLVTKSSGEFSVEDLPLNAHLKLSITAVGYSPISQDLTLKAADKDLGDLVLNPAAKELKEVVITATKPTMTLDMDKKVFNVSKDIVSAGGTGLDVLKNVPSVNVDIDGNVSLRGASPQLMVDGKPTTLTLDEIPADAIESVEVITNPSAKYDASGGGAGILNIVLKKNRKQGYNGSVRAGGDRYGGAQAGASLNVRENKINVSADINYRRISDRTTSSTQRTDLSTTPTTFIDQSELDTNKGYLLFGRLGVDYFISNRTTLSLTGFMMHHGATTTSNIQMNTDSLYSTGKVSGTGWETIDAAHTFNGRGGTLGIKHLFPKDKEEWTADASYFSGNATSNSLYTTELGSTTLQKIEGGGNDHNIILQSDYTDPLGKKTTLETGVRAALQSRLNINNNYTYNPDSSAYELVPAAASNYKSRSNVYAAYAILSSSINNFSYKIGLRAESSNYHGTLLNSGQSFGNTYPISLFPSLFFSQKLGNGQELQLSYTRRVNRPNFFQLIPYTDSSNKLNITRGNPNLVPEFTQSLELSYLKSFPGNNTILGSIYYKYTDHLITGYIEEDTTAGSTTLINTYINAESSYQMGAEVTAQNTITPWWDVSTNVNLYNSKINTGSALAQQALWSWFGKVNTNIKLPSSFTLQVSGLYQSKTNLPVNSNQNQPGPPNMQSQSASQGYIKPFYEVDLGVKKTFLSGKLAATLSFDDIFRSHKQDQYTYSTYLVQEYDRLRDPQMLRLNLSYNFGKVDASLFKRRNNNVSSEGE